jgi:hypothetical protein
LQLWASQLEKQAHRFSLGVLVMFSYLSQFDVRSQ